MPIYALVDAAGVIVNRITLEDESSYTPGDGLSLVAEGDASMEIGGLYQNGTYTPPERAPSTPVLIGRSISDRQFFQQLAVVGVISEDEALASNAAVIPPPLMAIINTMPTDQQFTAKMLVSGATVFERNHPMTIAIGTAYGWTSEQIDDFFTAAARL